MLRRETSGEVKQTDFEDIVTFTPHITWNILFVWSIIFTLGFICGVVLQTWL